MSICVPKPLDPAHIDFVNQHIAPHLDPQAVHTHMKVVHLFTAPFRRDVLPRPQDDTLRAAFSACRQYIYAIADNRLRLYLLVQWVILMQREAVHQPPLHDSNSNGKQ